ncbi:hypothetical protein GCM10007940_46160 [Portibacter lacus]|uniref:CDP-diacylglycerol--serine O-phosphatidyltransferase n=1 Tax=Portibacter lacus TaxID=1099794 RepID=A0AA37SYS3_9BACT|nr:hypothetical protein GCM10007940_46160 [Portibacter lacus]
MGGIFDVFDGLVARALNVSSKIGGELDSLADIISFGVAPAILFYKAFANEDQWIYLLGPIFIVVGGALRLARFNTTESKTSYFEGLAIPASGLVLCGLVFGAEDLTFINGNILIFLAIAICLSLLNVSTISMFSFKQFGMKRVKFYFGLIIVLGILCAVFYPLLVIVVTLLAYIALAVIDHLIRSKAA